MATNPMNAFIQHLRRTMLVQDQADRTDGQLLEDYISRRNEAALAALVHRHGPMVWGVCRRVLCNYHDAEDAFQATFLVLVRKATSIRPREMVANWLYGVAHQTALKATATAATRKSREKQVATMPEPAIVERDLWHDLQPLLDQELSRLPDKYRVLIVLCDLEGKTRKEAARQLGVPEGTVAGRLARARTMLAKRLAQRGVTLSGGALAALLAEKTASAAVPSSVVSSIIKAANLFAAGEAAATGVLSVKVAALTEGVLKSMLLTKLKTTMAVLLVVGLIAIPASGLVYHAMAGEEPNQKQRPVVQSDLLVKDQGEAEKELQRLRAELERLRTDYEELKKRLPQQVRTGKDGEVKLVVKVYPVAGLTSAIGEEEEAQPLMRVITNTIDPESWNMMGGKGSMEYFPEGGGILVIRQSPDIQKQVHDLLDTLRKTKTEQEKAEQEKFGK